MAQALIKAAFPRRVTDAHGNPVEPNHEAEFTPAKAEEFAARFGHSPEGDVIRAVAKPSRAAKAEAGE